MPTVTDQKKKVTETLSKSSNPFEDFMHDYYLSSRGIMRICRLFERDGIVRYRINWFKNGEIASSGYYRHRESDNKIWFLDGYKPAVELN